MDTNELQLLALRILRADDWWEDFWVQKTEKLLAA